jgi:hypothetical protein
LLHPECHLLLHNELAEDIREAQKLLSALYSCLDRLDPVPPDVFEGWEWISEWLNIKARALVYRNYLKTDRRAAA